MLLSEDGLVSLNHVNPIFLGQKALYGTLWHSLFFMLHAALRSKRRSPKASGAVGHGCPARSARSEDPSADGAPGDKNSRSVLRALQQAIGGVKCIEKTEVVAWWNKQFDVALVERCREKSFSRLLTRFVTSFCDLNGVEICQN